MIIVSVCVGSVCHLKGAHVVISEMQTLIKRLPYRGHVTLRAVFCRGRCMQAVSVGIGDEEDGPAFSVAPGGVDDFFEREVLPRVLDERDRAREARRAARVQQHEETQETAHIE